MNKTNCKAEVEAAQKDIDFTKNNYTVELTTNKGPIRIQFTPDIAPGHVKNSRSVQNRLLRRPHLPSHHRRFHDPGGLSGRHRFRQRRVQY